MLVIYPNRCMEYGISQGVNLFAEIPVCNVSRHTSRDHVLVHVMEEEAKCKCCIRVKQNLVFIYAHLGMYV